MTWFGLRSSSEPDPRWTPPAAPLVTRGSLVVECEGLNGQNAAERLIAYHRHEGWDRAINLTLGPGNVVTMQVTQGTSTTRIALAAPALGTQSRLRLTCAWDAPQRTGLLAIEDLTTGGLAFTEYDDPLPLPADDLWHLIHGNSSHATMLAVSDRIEPVGLNPGLAQGTLIDTPGLMRKIEALRPGDLVLTAEGNAVPLRRMISRRVPATGHFEPIRLRRPYFGLQRDILVAPHFRLAVSGGATEYLFDADRVLVEARSLLAHPAADKFPQLDEITYWQIVLDTHACINVSGAWGESLYLGTLQRTPGASNMAALGGLPIDDLPQHRRLVHTPLAPFESATLVAALGA